MSVDLKDPLASALGITPPWKVTSIEFSPEDGLKIAIDFPSGASFCCPVCGQQAPIHDTEQKKWRHLNFFQYKTMLTARVPRTRCPQCGTRQVPVPWANPRSGFTLLFESVVLSLARVMPVNSVAHWLGEHDTRLWRILRKYVEAARAKEDFARVVHVGVDETSIKRGHRYVTFFFDMDRHQLLFGTEGKDHTTVEHFINDFKEHNGVPGQVKAFCLDMSKAFIKGITEQFSEACLTFDRFHVMKLSNDVLAKLRAEESRKFPEVLRNTRPILLKNAVNLTPEEEKKLFSLTRFNLGSIKAYILKLQLQFVYEAQDLEEATVLFRKWLSRAVRSRIPHLLKLARTLREHQAGILSYFRSSLTNGLLEGFNSLIQAARAKARGYRNPKNLIAIAYLIAGKLKFDSCLST